MPRGTLITPVAVFIFFSLFPLAIIIFSPFGSFLLRQTKVTNGTVISAEANAERERVETTYKFLSVDGQEYRNTRYLREKTPYAGVKAGETIPVQFVVTNPTINRIAGGEKHDDDALIFLFLPLFFLSLILSPVILARLFLLLRDRTLFRSGQIADATVNFVKPSAVFMMVRSEYRRSVCKISAKPDITA